MIIGIDARPLIEKKTGIGYYLEYLLINILENDNRNKYILFSDRKIHSNVDKFNNVIFVEDTECFLKKSLWYMFKTNKLCKKHNVNVFWGTQHVLPLGLNEARKILTIHDLVAFDYKDTMSTYNKIINKILIPRSVKIADRIVAVSNSTKDRLNHYFGKFSEGKTTVIYEDVIVNRNFTGIESNYLSKNNLTEKKYIMFLGTIEPRKNIITLIRALDRIYQETGMKLLICGKYGWKCDEERDLIEKNKDKIVFLNYVTDEQKSYLMNKSFAFIFPSLYEGFGLPVLESIKNHTVAIVANNTSLVEIIDEKMLMFETLDYDDLADKVITIYNDGDLYNKLLIYCKKRSECFDWKEISKRYINEFSK